VERGGGHPGPTADFVEVDDVADTPVTVVEDLIAEPRAVTSHHRPVRSETRAARATTAPLAVAVTVVAVPVAHSEATCTRYVQFDIRTLISQVPAIRTVDYNTVYVRFLHYFGTVGLVTERESGP